MKISNTIVSGIVIVAILLSAYGLGLLIRQARTGSGRNQPPVEARDVTAARPHAVVPHAPGGPQTGDTAQARAKLKDQRAQDIEKMNSLTAEQKQKFRNQVRKQVGGLREDNGSQSFMSLLQRARKIQEQKRSEASRSEKDVNTPAPQGDGTDTKTDAQVSSEGADTGGPG
jgi:cell division septum initiation protein DivIVA